MQINWTALGAVALPNLGGIAGGLITKKNIPWYETLNRPQWRPPNWMFGPVWTGLYSGMGYASYIVYRDGGGIYGPAKLPLIVYGSNLLLNWAWTPIFFGARDLRMALAEIQLINITALGTGYLFYKINPVAGYLIIPYVLWLSVATSLNYLIYKNNRRPDTKETKD